MSRATCATEAEPLTDPLLATENDLHSARQALDKAKAVENHHSDLAAAARAAQDSVTWRAESDKAEMCRDQLPGLEATLARAEQAHAAAKDDKTVTAIVPPLLAGDRAILAAVDTVAESLASLVSATLARDQLVQAAQMAVMAITSPRIKQATTWTPATVDNNYELRSSASRVSIALCEALEPAFRALGSPLAETMKMARNATGTRLSRPSHQ